jgi:RHS repeat-associated protein
MLENYSVNNVNYDKNGNITTLNRKGLFENASNSTMSMDYVDKLTYQYSPKSNQLIDVTDSADNSSTNTFNGGFKDKFAGNNYIYGDANGNMTHDNNKNIQSISYNHLNLPTQIEFTGDRTIVYTYDASGVKLKKEIFLTVRDLFNPVADLTSIYAGNYIYEKDSSGEKLSFFSHPEGYIEKNGTDYDYVYQYKDHLGNVRLSYQDINNDGSVNSSEIKEENNYYPFGLKHKGYNNVVTGRDHKYGYGGKEEQDELGLEWHDFHARNYDASLGRWMNVDPLAEKFYDFTPYNYANNNPIYFIDPDGMESTEFNDGYTLNTETGTFTRVDDEGGNNHDVVYSENEDGSKGKKIIKKVAKGIIDEDKNFKTGKVIQEVNSIENDNVPSLEDFEKFITTVSDIIDMEIQGNYLSKNNEKEISIVFVQPSGIDNINNQAPFRTVGTKGPIPWQGNKLHNRGHWHTHPYSNPNSYDGKPANYPSNWDIKIYRDYNKKSIRKTGKEKLPMYILSNKAKILKRAINISDTTH